jgi:pre-mRNA-splicing factor 38A
MYIRLICPPKQVFEYLEPLYVDFRKIRYRQQDGKYIITFIDKFIEDLLNDESACDIKLPFLPKRWILENSNLIEPRVSLLDEKDLEELTQKEEIIVKEKSHKLKFKKGGKEENSEMMPDRESYLDVRNRKKAQEERYDEEDKNERQLYEKKRKLQENEDDEEDDDESKVNKNNDNLSIDESNKLRIQLGLKPLKN